MSLDHEQPTHYICTDGPSDGRVPMLACWSRVVCANLMLDSPVRLQQQQCHRSLRQQSQRVHLQRIYKLYYSLVADLFIWRWGHIFGGQKKTSSRQWTTATTTSTTSRSPNTKIANTEVTSPPSHQHSNILKSQTCFQIKELYILHDNFIPVTSLDARSLKCWTV